MKGLAAVGIDGGGNALALVGTGNDSNDDPTGLAATSHPVGGQRDLPAARSNGSALRSG
jgi:hypothetical protein